MNDVSGLRWDREMAKTVAELKCGVVLMHMRGRPGEWRTLPPPVDIVLQVKRELREWMEAAVVAGVRREKKLLSIRGLVSEKTLSRTTLCWPAFRTCNLWECRCWRGLRENRLLAACWQKTEKMRQSLTGYMEISRHRLS